MLLWNMNDLISDFNALKSVKKRKKYIQLFFQEKKYIYNIKIQFTLENYITLGQTILN